MGVRVTNKDKFRIGKVLFFVSLGMPFIQLTSVLTGAAIISLLVVIYLYVVVKKVRTDIYISFVLILFVYGEVLALYNCPDLIKTFVFSGQKLMVLLLLYPAMKYYISDDIEQHEAFRLYCFGCMITGAFVLMSGIFHVSVPFVGYAYKTGRVVLSEFGPNVTARLFCIAAVYMLYRAQVTKKGEKLRCYLVWLMLSLCLGMTLSISGILLYAIGIVAVYLIFNKGIQKYGIIKLLIIIMFGAAFIYMAYLRIEVFRSLVERVIIRITMTNTNDDISNGRFDGLNNFFELLPKHFLTGIGYGCSSVVSASGKTIHFPILAAIIETGIFGFISCVILYGVPAFRNIYILIQKRGKNIFCIISLLMILGDMIQPNPNYLFTFFAVFISMCGKNNKERTTNILC